jgi:hypothetical protein
MVDCSENDTTFPLEISETMHANASGVLVLTSIPVLDNLKRHRRCGGVILLIHIDPVTQKPALPISPSTEVTHDALEILI